MSEDEKDQGQALAPGNNLLRVNEEQLLIHKLYACFWLPFER